MAWNYYLNLEGIALRAARDAVATMTEDNRCPGLPDDYYDTDAFVKNLQHGFVALVMVLSYLECAINSTLRDYVGYDPKDNLIGASLEIKLEVLMHDHKEEYDEIRRHNSWKAFCDAKSVRNNLVHYKNNKANTMSSVPPLGSWKIGKQTLGEFFTQSSMEGCVENVVALSREVVHALGLELADNLPAIVTDASGVPISYIYNPNDYDDNYLAEFALTNVKNKDGSDAIG